MKTLVRDVGKPTFFRNEEEEESSAINHIRRNGSLLFWNGDAQRMYSCLIAKGKIEQNKWPGKWQLK